MKMNEWMNEWMNEYALTLLLPSILFPSPPPLSSSSSLSLLLPPNFILIVHAKQHRTTNSIVCTILVLVLPLVIRQDKFESKKKEEEEKKMVSKATRWNENRRWQWLVYIVVLVLYHSIMCLYIDKILDTSSFFLFLYILMKVPSDAMEEWHPITLE